MRSRWVVPALIATVGVALTAPQALAAPRTAAPAAAAPAAVAPAEKNGLAVNAPLMGWSDWGFLQRAPTAATFDAQAKALVIRRSGPLDGLPRFQRNQAFQFALLLSR